MDAAVIVRPATAADAAALAEIYGHNALHGTGTFEEAAPTPEAMAARLEAVLAQDKATDSWNEYQADSLKRHMYEIAAVAGGPKAAEYEKEIDKDRTGQDKAREKAEDAEKERDLLLRDSARHEQRHHWLTGAATLIEIGIALSTVAIITSRRTFWFSAMGLGTVGAALSAVAYLR